MKSEDFIYFGSSTKYKELSNFYECKIHYNGLTYNSLEHAYQSLKFIQSDRIRFSEHGDLGNYDSILKHGKMFYGKNITNEKLDKKIYYWKKRKCIGIVAKLASNIKFSKKLNLKYQDLTISEKKKYFMELLTLKYNIDIFKDILKNTENKILIEFSKSAKRLHDKNITEIYTGLVVDGILYGENKMGNYIMEIREKILIE